MIYWRHKKDNGDGDLEDFFPGDVIELAESKQELARKVQKRRLRWPHHVFDDVLGVSPCEVPEAIAQGFCGPREEDRHAAGDDVVDSLQYTAPHAATPVPPPVAPAVAAATPPLPPPAVLLVDAQQTPPLPALMPVMPQGAQHCSEAETTQKDLGNGVKISKEKWLFLMAQPKDTLLVRDTAKAIWGIQNLYNRSITGTPCRRFLHKEDGGPPSVEKQALTPRKLDALRNAYEEHLKVHESQLPVAQRRRNMNRHLADLLKVLKK
ncbi:hypothetical protein HPB51_027809 [Rhipicephalus microplus]|uniref:BEN domain-containing protein n=1 Tax=Rhipicephalus microplus TaxID=6941 RepID=A0A9J6CYV8_RHIMP|nr:hypothetical protein HPB51_027809 [Rhipicephalus microplus]